jgi:hypothetical protein
MPITGEALPGAEARADKQFHLLKRIQRQEVMPEEGSWEWYNQFADRKRRVTLGPVSLPPHSTFRSRDFTQRDLAEEYYHSLEDVTKQLIFKGNTVHCPWQVRYVTGQESVYTLPAKAPKPEPERLMCQHTPDMIRNAAHKRFPKRVYTIDRNEARMGPITVLSRHRTFRRAYGRFNDNKEGFGWSGVVRVPGGFYELRVRR